MPTPAERKALLFLAGVIVLGASVRVVRAARDDGHADASSRQALARQLAAVDSAQLFERGKPRTRSAGGARGRRPRSQLSASRASPDSGVPARVLPQLRTSAAPRPRVVRDSAPIPVVPVDLDRAGETDIEALPRIGPVLARRIVEDRAANGPFGSIEGLERVSGVGPALAGALRERVTFSGTARPSNAIVRPRLRSPPTASKSPRRQRRS